MLLKQTHFPLEQGGNIPWGTIILAVIIVGGLSYVAYERMQAPKIMKKPNS